MPYRPDHKAQTRARIVESARQMFNRHGFDQVSIDDVMQHAGLTRGGFYAHFQSKQALYAAAVQSFTTCNPFATEVARGPERTPGQLACLLIDLYLSDETLDNVEQQCPLIALPSDVARAGLQPRAAYTQLVSNMLHVFKGALGETLPRREADRKAELIVSLCVGGMVLARTTDDPGLRKTLRASARAEARRILGVAPGLPPTAAGGTRPRSKPTSAARSAP